MDLCFLPQRRTMDPTLTTRPTATRKAMAAAYSQLQDEKPELMIDDDLCDKVFSVTVTSIYNCLINVLTSFLLIWC